MTAADDVRGGQPVVTDQLNAVISAALIVTASDHIENKASDGRFLREAAESVERAVRRHLGLPGAETHPELMAILARTDMGCPNTPNCGHLLVEHRRDGWDGNGNAINPRCP